MFGISEIAILLIVVIVFLGAKKLPELARNAGKAARILKSESKAMKSQGSAQEATYQVTESRPVQDPAQQGTSGTHRTDASPGPTTGSVRP
ncbi:twin-arginine translocase TatA/TatE family subunit [Streptomyces sp. NPDC046316]|uniref:twin-arginine translocase TatA/TatE family subunit n=1 Tax=Streptomyces sp. NPDC046316 TaxID=3154494 RepID=UPI0033E25A5C